MKNQVAWKIFVHMEHALRLASRHSTENRARQGAADCVFGAASCERLWIECLIVSYEQSRRGVSHCVSYVSL